MPTKQTLSGNDPAVFELVRALGITDLNGLREVTLRIESGGPVLVTTIYERPITISNVSQTSESLASVVKEYELWPK